MENNYNINNKDYSILPPFENYFHEESYKDISYIKYLTETIDPDEGYGRKLRPVFIVLIFVDDTFSKIANKLVKHEKYWHAAIGFGPSLKRTYSFNFSAPEYGAGKLKGGLSFESLDSYKEENENGLLEVSCILLAPDRYEKLKDTLDYYIMNKDKTKFAFGNLVKSLFGIKSKNKLRPNLNCSTFVDTILKSAGVDISDKDYSNLVKPDDLRVSRKHEKHFKVYSGKIKNYNIEKATEAVDELAKHANNDFEKEIEANRKKEEEKKTED